MKKGDDDNAEEEPTAIKINGAAIRTPDEDITWEAEQKELEANAPKGGKAPPKGKKKWLAYVNCKFKINFINKKQLMVF